MKKNKVTLRRAINCAKPCWQTSAGYHSQEFFEKWGFHYEDIWNLDFEIAYFTLVRLVHYREAAGGIPGVIYWRYDKNDAKAKRAWENIVDKMIRAFYLYCTEFMPDEEQQKIIDKGFKLFAEWHRSLWD